MKLTNYFNVPRPFYEAIKKMSWKPNPDKLYVTQLGQPPMIRHLQIKYWDEMEVDASDFFYRLFGQAMHHVLEDAAKDLPDVVVEKSYSIPAEVFGIEISMRVDWIEGTPYVTVGEAKTAGVMSIKNGVKDDWIYQANVYRYAINFIDKVLVKKLKAYILLRDWIPSKLREDGYPRTPFVELDIPILPLEEVHRWIQERVNIHLSTPVPQCTMEDKWQDPDHYAVMEKGKVKAIAATVVGEDGERRNIESKEEAEEIIHGKGLTKEYERGKIYIATRVGEPRHCLFYCDCREICKKVNGWKV
jgi:hypothetical protein